MTLADISLNQITFGLGVATAIMALATVYLGVQTQASVSVARRALLHEHVEQVKQLARARQEYVRQRPLTTRITGHIDMTEPMAEIFAEHFGSVAARIADWNKAVIERPCLTG